ncbi:HupE/UreJ family protein [Tepidimonas aquatica]|uniref:HupE / UreJ protein n=1 Tax=Tepidimonas aquatica TaxID=247482 RepID=A0A554WLU3_9BURK|nr:HupE/UreJ family protein [Tepidimonas aquatica]TSE24552.1 HupE / UreJ protein [Tepidimonas aquatica]
MKRFTLPTALFLLLASGTALAHPGHDGGLVAGLTHPYTGLDHLLAMVAVGLWSAQQPAKDALWKIPLAFVSVMAVGAFMGMTGLPLPQVENGIVASVVFLGLLVAFSLRLHTGVGMALVAAFALFHGYAHGAEAPRDSLAAFATGFVLATASLHGLGVALGWYTHRRAEVILRVGGAGVALAGAWLALN